MTHPMFLGGIGLQELLIVLVLVLLLYGGKKVPEMMRGLGQGVKAFKEGMNTDDPAKPADATKTAEPAEPNPEKGEKEEA